MQQNREHRTRSHIEKWPNDILTRLQGQFNRERIMYLTNVVRSTGYPYAQK